MVAEANPGVYRGIVVDNKDPQGLGRIRVSVPRIMGESATGWAFPAWTLHDWTIWPEDRIPTTDQGVWVIFEGPDRITWLATYGAQEFSRQNLDDPLTSGDDQGNLYTYQTFITWEFSVLPQDVAITIPGTLTSKSGTPQPTPVVIFQRSSTENGPWYDTSSTAKVNDDGTWSFVYTRPGTEQNYWYRTVYAGSDPFWPVATDPLQVKDTATSVAWTPPPASPPSQYWKTPVNITGSLLDHNNAGLPDKPVVIRISSNQTTWTDLATATTIAGGVFSYSYTRNDINPVYMRVHFLGDLTKDASVSANIGTFSTVLVPTTITWTFPALTFNVPATVTGTFGSASYGIPPGTLDLVRRLTPGSGAFTKIQTITPNATTGNWSFSITQTDPTVEYAVQYPGFAPYQFSETSDYQTRNVASNTTTTAPTLPATLTHGVSFTATGSVKDSLNRPATTGSCKLHYRFANGPDTTWKPTGANAVTPNASGNYSIVHPALTVVGPLDWKVVYTGAGAFLSSESAATSKSIGLAAVTGLTKNPSDIGTSYGYTYWNAVSGATYYEVLLTNVNWYYPEGTGIGVGGLAEDTTYTYQVGAIKQDAAGNWVYGATASASFHTGRSEQRKSGSFGYETRPTGTGSYRPSTGWGYIGDKVAQGYYSVTSNNYTGVLDYDENYFQQWVADRWGWDTVGNLNFTAARVAMYRVSGVGTGNPVGVWWYVSNSYPNGPVPALAGGEARGSLTPGASAWVDLPYPHWAKHVLLRENIGGTVGTVYSLATYRYNSGEYCQWHGMSAGGNVCNLYVECNWNFQIVAPASPYWF